MHLEQTAAGYSQSSDQTDLTTKMRAQSLKETARKEMTAKMMDTVMTVGPWVSAMVTAALGGCLKRADRSTTRRQGDGGGLGVENVEKRGDPASRGQDALLKICSLLAERPPHQEKADPWPIDTCPTENVIITSGAPRAVYALGGEHTL